MCTRTSKIQTTTLRVYYMLCRLFRPTMRLCSLVRPVSVTVCVTICQASSRWKPVSPLQTQSFKSLLFDVDIQLIVRPSLVLTLFDLHYAYRNLLVKTILNKPVVVVTGVAIDLIRRRRRYIFRAGMGKHINDTYTMRWEAYFVRPQSGRRPMWLSCRSFNV